MYYTFLFIFTFIYFRFQFAAFAPEWLSLCRLLQIEGIAYISHFKKSNLIFSVSFFHYYAYSA